jgi:hypothetical protein
MAGRAKRPFRVLPTSATAVDVPTCPSLPDRPVRAVRATGADPGRDARDVDSAQPGRQPDRDRAQDRREDPMKRYWFGLAGLAGLAVGMRYALRQRPLDVRGRVVIVTGASSGIGRATAHAFAARGARVVLAARRADRLAAIQAELAIYGVPPDRAAPQPRIDLAALVERTWRPLGGSTCGLQRGWTGRADGEVTGRLRPWWRSTSPHGRGQRVVRAARRGAARCDVGSGGSVSPSRAGAYAAGRGGGGGTSLGVARRAGRRRVASRGAAFLTRTLMMRTRSGVSAGWGSARRAEVAARPCGRAPLRAAGFFLAGGRDCREGWRFARAA